MSDGGEGGATGLGISFCSRMNSVDADINTEPSEPPTPEGFVECLCMMTVGRQESVRDLEWS